MADAIVLTANIKGNPALLIAAIHADGSCCVYLAESFFQPDKPEEPNLNPTSDCRSSFAQNFEALQGGSSSSAPTNEAVSTMMGWLLLMPFRRGEFLANTSYLYFKQLDGDSAADAHNRWLETSDAPYEIVIGYFRAAAYRGELGPTKKGIHRLKEFSRIAADWAIRSDSESEVLQSTIFDLFFTRSLVLSLIARDKDSSNCADDDIRTQILELIRQHGVGNRSVRVAYAAYRTVARVLLGLAVDEVVSVSEVQSPLYEMGSIVRFARTLAAGLRLHDGVRYVDDSFFTAAARCFSRILFLHDDIGLPLGHVLSEERLCDARWPVARRIAERTHLLVAQFSAELDAKRSLDRAATNAEHLRRFLTERRGLTPETHTSPLARSIADEEQLIQDLMTHVSFGHWDRITERFTTELIHFRQSQQCLLTLAKDWKDAFEHRRSTKGAGAPGELEVWLAEVRAHIARHVNEPQRTRFEKEIVVRWRETIHKVQYRQDGQTFMALFARPSDALAQHLGWTVEELLYYFSPTPSSASRGGAGMQQPPMSFPRWYDSVIEVREAAKLFEVEYAINATYVLAANGSATSQEGRTFALGLNDYSKSLANVLLEVYGRQVWHSGGLSCEGTLPPSIASYLLIRLAASFCVAESCKLVQLKPIALVPRSEEVSPPVMTHTAGIEESHLAHEPKTLKAKFEKRLLESSIEINPYFMRQVLGDFIFEGAETV